MSHFVLVDCNNFYVSCERLFDPSLENRPVIILSNNDGCAVARSQEAKQCGIKMGEPYFKIKDQCDRLQVHVFSSNYQLYGDISQRVMEVLAQMAPEIEVYSIDEAFLKYPAEICSQELFKICLELKRRIKRWVGVPVSLGIGPSKTLAKMANGCAKESVQGVFSLSSKEERLKLLENYPIEDVWGIGRGYVARLNRLNVFTAADFARQDVVLIRQHMGVVGQRMLYEMNGISCLDLEEPACKQSITCSRSFGRAVSEEGELAEALATFVTTAAVKLRKEKSCAQALCIFLETQIEPGQPGRRHWSLTTSFLHPTQDTAEMITAAKRCLKRLFRPKERYKKCGIVLLDFVAVTNLAPDLFWQGLNPKRQAMMTALDDINARFGKNTLFFGAMGINPQWKMRSEFKSVHNSTSWQHLPIVKAVL